MRIADSIRKSLGLQESLIEASEDKKAAMAASKVAMASGKKSDHLKAAELHGAYANKLADRMSARGQGFSHSLGYHSDMQSFHLQAAKGEKKIGVPQKHNPRNDPSSRSFQYRKNYPD
jgi:hypothetical protein